MTMPSAEYDQAATRLRRAIAVAHHLSGAIENLDGIDPGPREALHELVRRAVRVVDERVLELSTIEYHMEQPPDFGDDGP